MEYKRITAVVEKELEFIVCTGCGSLVFDGDAHNNWHDSITQAIKNGDYAATMLRPLGPGPKMPSDGDIAKQVERLFKK